MNIYLVRHAESVGNIKGSLISTTDFELTEKGRLQAKRVGYRLAEELQGKTVEAYCSPLLRARQTMQEILSCIGQDDALFIQTEDLKEMDLGILEGMPFDEQKFRFPDIDLGSHLSVLSAPQGECYQDVKKRVCHFADHYIYKSFDKKDILIVSHGITLRVLTNVLLQRPDKDVDFLNWFENTAQTVLTYDSKNEGFYIKCLNDYTHLRELETANFKTWGLFAPQEAYIETANWV